MTDDETVTLDVIIEQQFEIPVDILADTETSTTDLEARAEDHFWSHWSEFMSNNPPYKEQMSVVSSRAPHTIGGERRCTECGTSVEDEPYGLWLFHTCRSCAEAAATEGEQ